MKKSQLEKEFAKQLRLIRKQLKELQSGEISFNPEEIEAIARKRTPITEQDITRLRGYAEEIKIPKQRTAEEYIRKGRKQKKPEEARHPRKRLSEEEKKERRNFQARKHRLEKQGYDVSQIGKASDYTLDQLKELKRGALSSMVFKDGESAYDIKKREANEKRQQTKKLRERINEIYKQQQPQEMEYIRKPELGDFREVGQGALATHFVDTSIIEVLLQRFQSLENVYKIPLEGRKQFLVGLLYDIITEHDDDNDGLLLFEDYLRSRESEIMSLCDKITYDSKDERIDVYFANLFSILNQGALTQEQSERIAQAEENYNYDYTD